MKVGTETMGEKHIVKFEPVDLDMEVDEDETILDAAFRQGVALMHGCREGQCGACKSFLVEGDVQMDRYSTFALADYESDAGYVLLCKAHAYSELTVELINFDEEELRNAVPLQHLRTRIAAIDSVTHDIVSLRLALVEPASFAFKPGQYADIRIPDDDGHRSFSMATTPASSTELEFLIKKYPGGHFSGLLDSVLKVGDELELDGPYGSFTLHERSERPIICIGGGAGMAPILSLLRHMSEEETKRPVTFYYGARNPTDLFYLDEIRQMGDKLPEFRFVPCLSETWPENWADLGVAGESGLVTNVVKGQQQNMAGCEFYLCGPPPMVDAALELLESNGVPFEQVHFDKFTTSVAQ
jgi:propane monooxygenase reductase subunit